MKKLCWLITVLLSTLLSACSSKPPMDLTDTNLYLYPYRYFDSSSEFDFTFSEKERAKALKYAKSKNLDILYEVYLAKDGSVRSIKKIRNTKYASPETVINIRHQLKAKDFFRTYRRNSAFFYGVRIRTEIEVTEY